MTSAAGPGSPAASTGEPGRSAGQAMAVASRADSAAVDPRALTLLSQQLDDEVVTAIVDAYLGQLRQRSAALREATEGAGTPLRDAAHSLTASSLTVGATALGQLCRDVEDAVVREDDERARELAGLALRQIDSVAAVLAATRWASTSV